MFGYNMENIVTSKVLRCNRQTIASLLCSYERCQANLVLLLFRLSREQAEYFQHFGELF